MNLDRPFLKLPVTVAAEVLAEEVRALPRAAWQPHPQRFVGNEAIPLVTPAGEITNAVEGPMAPTEYLLRCPYILRIMEELGAVWGRSRLMGLGPGADVPVHVDIDYYWRTHLRVHIPVITNPAVDFTCDGETVHMAAGECWLFDTFRRHGVRNGGSEQRIHLVMDTVGGERLWELMRAAEEGAPASRIEPGETPADNLAFEQINVPAIMSHWEVRGHVAFLAEQAQPHERLDNVLRRLDKFISGWTAAWSRFGDGGDGIDQYRALVATARHDLLALGSEQISLRNGRPLALALDRLLFANAVGRAVTSAPRSSPAAAAATSPTAKSYRERIEKPVFILSPPRSGSTLLFQTFAEAPELFTIGAESHRAIESIPYFSPAARDWDSNRLTAEDARPVEVEQLAQNFYANLRDRDGRPPVGSARMLEKTPKNALRVPFLDTAFDDSRFIYLYRDVRQTLSSMMEAWLSGRFRTYPALPGWTGHPWSLLLVPGWRDLRGRPLPEVVAHQWAITTNHLLDDLEAVPRERLRVVAFDQFLAAPQLCMEKLAQSLDLDWDRTLQGQLPLSRTTLSRPDADKWRRNAPAIESVWPIVASADARARAFAADFLGVKLAS